MTTGIGHGTHVWHGVLLSFQVSSELCCSKMSHRIFMTTAMSHGTRVWRDVTLSFEMGCELCRKKLSHVIYENESLHIWKWVTSYMKMSHFLYENESRHTYDHSNESYTWRGVTPSFESAANHAARKRVTVNVWLQERLKTHTYDVALHCLSEWAASNAARQCVMSHVWPQEWISHSTCVWRAITLPFEIS